jgi:hypothetical protein
VQAIVAKKNSMHSPKKLKFDFQFKRRRREREKRQISVAFFPFTVEP